LTDQDNEKCRNDGNLEFWNDENRRQTAEVRAVQVVQVFEILEIFEIVKTWKIVESV
jgi:hypothetical protein